MTGVTVTRPPGRPPATAVGALRSFYARPIAWGGALLVSATLSYVGGAAMFWLHAIYRQEHGPSIGHLQHWLLDSTLGFVALTPVILLLLPAALWLRRNDVGSARIRLAVYVLMVGTLFALVTGPGPFLHNRLVGADTPLANFATDVFGEDPSIGHHGEPVKENSALSEGTLQVVVGIPLYSVLTWAAVGVVRRTSAGSARRRSPAERTADDPLSR